MRDWKKLTSKVVYKNPYFEVREDEVVRPDGEKGVYYVIDRASCVVVIPLTENNQVYLININRYTTGKTHWEIPVGSSDNQEELIAAKRELQEETGLVSHEWEFLGKHELASGWSSQLTHIFLAKHVRETEENQQQEEGIKQVKKFPFNNVLEMIEKGEIVDSNSIAGLTLAAMKLKLLQVRRI